MPAVGWIKKVVATLKGPGDELGGAAAPPPARNPARPSRSSQQALSGYGNNPYDTYTWDLHQAPDEERELKRSNDNRRDPKPGDKTNPYDTGAFRGGWK
jgi:hypothetical protein